MSLYRAVLFWEEDDTDPDVFANRLAMYLSAMRGAEPALAGWLRRVDDVDVAIDGPAACAEALRSGAQPFGKDRVVHHLQLHVTAQPVERADEPEYLGEEEPVRRVAPPLPGTRAAELFLGWGHRPVPGLPAWLPNRLELRVHAGIGEHGATRSLWEALMKTAVTTFKPDWGFVGSEGRPTAPLPMMNDGSPVVGWLTYLGKAYTAVPQFEHPVVKHVAGQGTLIVAVQGSYDEKRKAHKKAIAHVKQRLADAGMLVPARTLVD